jgi:phospholipase/carboxylesterase
MALMQTTLEHRVLMPEQPGSGKNPLLVMLHGRGADEEDLIDVARFYDPRLLVVSPRAPFAFPHGGFTWYDVDETGNQNQAMFRESCERLSAFLDGVVNGYPVDAGQVYLLGFSMGTVMSYAMSLSRPSLFRGVIANSGYVPEGTFLTLQWDKIGHIEYFIAHGTEDPIIPLRAARRARELFAASPAKITYKEYPMGHQLSDESIADSAAFLQHLLPHS